MKDKKFESRRKLILELMESEIYLPMRAKEMSAFMQVPKHERLDFREVLDSLIEDGLVRVGDRGRLMLPEKTLQGILDASPSGFGFVCAEGMDTDIFIPRDKVGDAMHGDLVSVRINKAKEGNKKAEGEITGIIERNTESLVGTFVISEGKKKSRPGEYGFIIPDNAHYTRDIFVSRERSKGAKDGQKVVVRITDYGDMEKHRKCEGIISQVLGYVTDKGVDILTITKAYGLDEVFPEDVKKEADRVALPVSDDAVKGRKDLRDKVIFTIDGDDSKDFDDAVSLDIKEGLYYLGVHIADVTAYVMENSSLDRQARLRGTSVYLPGLVIPMLPESLSNGICSLNPHEDRLTLSCMMTIDGHGKIVDSEIVESVINSKYRLTYSNVNAVIEDKDPLLCEKYETILPVLNEMNRLAGILRKKRRKRGSIDFDFPEAKIVLDEDGHVTDIKPAQRNSATSLIEEFMIAANETVAETCCFMEIPFIYRSHEVPDGEKLEKLNAFVNGFGYHLKIPKGDMHPSQIQKLLDSIGERPEEALIERLTLRSLKQAKYTTEPLGHFGLASKYYCHFTSPIRRYPDLQIHRIIKDNLHGKLDGDRMSHYEAFLDEVALSSSRLERRAAEAERECEKLKKTEYMEGFIGQTFKGVISGVTDWGIYVELENTVEGMIPLRDLADDFYEYFEDEYLVCGRSTGRIYKLGQSIKIRVERADIQLRELDFLPCED